MSKSTQLSKATIIIAAVLVVILFLIGMYTYNSFFALTLPIIDGITYQGETFSSPFKMVLIYSLTLALIPVATVLVWKYANIHTATKKIMALLMIMVSVSVSTFLRYKWFIAQTKNLTKTNARDTDGNEYEFMISLSSVNIDGYMAAGLLGGALVSFLILRQKNPRSI